MATAPDGDLPEYESEGELATRTGTTAKFWRTLRQKGGGPSYFKLSNRLVRYKRSEADAWLAARARESTFDGRDAA
jgi:predicted DNA-binding transcriptional regulator AlpA